MGKKFEELSQLKKDILLISAKFIDDWNISPGMGFLAGVIKPMVSVERIRQALMDLEKEGFIKRTKKDKYYKSFVLTD